MRTSTFFLSLVVHSLLIGAALVVRIMAANVLPVPRDATTFVAVTREVPQVAPPPAAAPRRVPPAAIVNRDAAPVVAPRDILPEPLDVAPDAPIGADLIAGSGDVPGAIAPPPAAVRPQAMLVAPVPVRVGGDVRPPQKIHHVAPVYPDLARSARVSGVVILEALLAEDGSVRDVKVLRSVPLLDGAAREAVRQWRFTPTLLNGVPVPVLMTVTVAFTLN